MSANKLLLLFFIPTTMTAQLSGRGSGNEYFNQPTQHLYQKLANLPKGNILIGHQDALAYGVNWKDLPGRSDMKDVCGTHPAVFGWDVGKLGGQGYNIDTVDFTDIQQWIKQVDHLGGINTISWHMDNPVSQGDAWNRTRAVARILPGGDHHFWLVRKLDQFAHFLSDLYSEEYPDQLIPILFRPYHEHTGNWFWWGKNHCSVQGYIALWRFTVRYLRINKGLKNLLFVYAPDRVSKPKDYLERYPGDEFVDILGLDDYRDVGIFGNPRRLTKRLRMLVNIAEKKDKPAALTETGQERLPNRRWWTKVIYSNVFKDPKANRIAYLLVWRNANTNHFFSSYRGHHSAEDFANFTKQPGVYMLDDWNKFRKRLVPKF